jgi:hypothetical protein
LARLANELIDRGHGFPTAGLQKDISGIDRHCAVATGNKRCQTHNTQRATVPIWHLAACGTEDPDGQAWGRASRSFPGVKDSV